MLTIITTKSRYHKQRKFANTFYFSKSIKTEAVFSNELSVKGSLQNSPPVIQYANVSKSSIA